MGRRLKFLWLSLSSPNLEKRNALSFELKEAEAEANISRISQALTYTVIVSAASHCSFI